MSASDLYWWVMRPFVLGHYWWTFVMPGRLDELKEKYDREYEEAKAELARRKAERKKQ